MNLNPDLINLIYDVPLGNSQWTAVLKKLRDVMQAGLALMYVFPPKGPPVVFATEPESDVIWDDYRAHYWTLDPWQSAIKRYQAFNVMQSGEKLLDFNAFQKTSFYNDYWHHWGFKHTAGGYVRTKMVEFIIGIPRLMCRPTYTAAELRVFNYYVAHMRRALEMEGMNGQSLPQYFYQSALGSHFGLTKSEASLALALIKYDGLKEASEALSRSYNTSKSQLAAVFRKTETNSQMALVKKLLTRTE